MGEDNNMNLEEHTFQEQTRYKLAVSAFIACIGLMCLGFGLAFAGQSDAARIAADNSSGEVEDSNTALSSGYGLATFIFIVAFVIFVCAGIYLSPLCCGTAKESEFVMSSLAGQNFNSGEGRPLPQVPAAASEDTAEMPIESLYADKSSAV